MSLSEIFLIGVISGFESMFGFLLIKIFLRIIFLKSYFESIIISLSSFSK